MHLALLYVFVCVWCFLGVLQPHPLTQACCLLTRAACRPQSVCLERVRLFLTSTSLAASWHRCPNSDTLRALQVSLQHPVCSM